MPQPETPPSPSVASGESVELLIERLAAGGDGVAHAADGRVIFVPRTAPGDRVRARVTRVRRRFARAELEAVLVPGPDRCEPRCSFYGSCGGCSWQHLSYPAQCDAKIAIVEDALRRIGGLALDAALPLTPSPDAYGYRSRARVLRSRDAVGYRRRGSNELCPVDACPVLVPLLERRLAELAAGPLAEGDIPRSSRSVEDWELVADAAAGRARPTRRGAAPSDVDGEPVELSLGTDRLRVSPGVFFQANAALHAALLDAVCREAGRGALAIDLFAGAGFFSLPLARCFDRVVAVESYPPAVDDLRHNLARAGLTGVEVIQARVEDGLARRVSAGVPPDALLLDPPRTGLAPGGLDAVLELAAERIVYLSCDPATLSRDLVGLLDAGYRLEHAEAFDLFPQTAHVEVLTRLARPRGGSGP